MTGGGGVNGTNGGRGAARTRSANQARQAQPDNATLPENVARALGFFRRFAAEGLLEVAPGLIERVEERLRSRCGRRG